MKRKIITAFVLLAFCVAAAKAAEQGDLRALFNLGYQALEDWKYSDADKTADQVQTLLAKETQTNLKAQAYVFLAQYWFDKGDYGKSLANLDLARGLSHKQDKEFEKFYGRVKQLAQIFANAASAESEHFKIRWSDPRDEIMVKPGLETLEKQYQALGKDFNFYPSGEKIVVDIYPKTEYLAAGVGLELEMIKNSGTVAVCKFRRLMMVSPRNLLYGFDYQTTLSHELVHFFVYERNGESVPVWLHEGLAKFEDGSYKNEAGRLDPVSQSLIASAIKNNELITFSQMHPTFAQFKTPKQGQLAFAEVNTMIEYLRHRCGNDAWFKILDLLKSGKGDKTAIEQVCAQNFASVWEGWKNYVSAKNWRIFPGAQVMKMEFKEQSGREEDEEIETGKGKAYEYVRLGDLLRDRGALSAASFEYQKAAALEPYHPRILNKLGLSRVLAGNYKEALDPLIKVTRIYPDYSTGFINLGLAYFGLKDEANALAAFEQATALNPFNPIPYERMAEIYQKRGDNAKINEMKSAYAIIMKKPGG